MFAFAEKYNTALKVMLGLISLSFVAVGVESYSNTDDPNDLARVGSEHITRQDLARYMGDKPRTPDSIKQTLDAAVSERMRVAHARSVGMAISDAQLASRIASEPSFQEDGKFSAKRYQRFLDSQSMSSAMLESRLRQDLLARQLTFGTLGSGFDSQFNLQRYEAMFGEQREVAQITLSADDYKGQVVLAADAAKKYYDSHMAEFRIPEQVKLEYVVLSQQELARKMAVTDAEVQKYYEQNKAQLSAEQRKARHILLSVDSKASAEAKAKIKARAEELLQQAKQNPAKFAELAKQYSQDPGSAALGGDLGYVGRGMMVPAFDAAMFAMNKGEVRGPVETPYGYHILLLDDVKVQSFDDVKPQIEAQLRAQKATASFQGVADKFSDILYQQADSLEPAIKEFGLTVRQSDWVSRSKAADPLLNNPKLLEAAFSDDVLKKKHNSEPVDVGGGNMVAVRVLEHRAESTLPLAQAQADIIAKLTAEEAKKLAAKDGQAKTKDLNAGKADALAWKNVGSVSRMATPNMTPEAVSAVFKLPATKLPAYVGLDTDNGYALFKVSKVTAGELAADKRAQLQQLLERVRLETEAKAYFGQLSAQHKVEINKKALSQMQ